MKTLIIVRHGTFSHTDPLIADVDRPLNPHGYHQVSVMAGQFATLSLQPDLLVSSPAKRAIESAEIYAKKLGIAPETIQVEEDIFEAERSEILRVVRALDDAAETVILFGHHPGVTKLLHHLVDGGVEKMPLGAFAVLELDAESWNTVSFKKGKLLNVGQPKEKDRHQGWWWPLIFWSRQRVQKIELFLVFLVGLIVILGAVALIVKSSTDSAGMPAQGSMGR